MNFTHQGVPEDVFMREPSLVVDQAHFSSDINQVVLVPVRAELSNLQLHRFLNQMHSVNPRNNTGVIFLINDNEDDTREKTRLSHGVKTSLPQAVAENRLTAQYLGHIATGNVKAIDELETIPQEYKDIAKSIIESGFWKNIRYDYVGARKGGQSGTPHFGLLRTYLLDLGSIFKNPQVSEDDVIVHMMDVDAAIHPDHIAHIQHWYAQDRNRKANISEWDLSDDAHFEENPEFEKTLRETYHFYRAYRYAEEISLLLLGKYMVSIPCISARLSYFYEPDEFGITPRSELYSHASNEDYYLAEYLGNRLRRALGHEGEVSLSDRTRESRFFFAESDAQRRYDVTRSLQSGQLTIYKVNPEYERKKAQTGWRDRESLRHPKGDFIPFPQGLSDYLAHTKQLISKEFLGNRDLGTESDYVQFEREELEKENRKTEGSLHLPEEAALHQSIATLRAIKRYLLAHDLTVIERRRW